jgi:hypothetical protein
MATIKEMLLATEDFLSEYARYLEVAAVPVRSVLKHFFLRQGCPSLVGAGNVLQW